MDDQNLLLREDGYPHLPSSGKNSTGETMSYEAFREQCAKVCDDHAQMATSGDGNEWSASCAEAIRALPLPEVKFAPIGVDDLVAVHRSLLGAACSAISKKRDAPRTVANLRRHTTGDLSVSSSVEYLRKENEQLRKRITALENACAFQSVELNAIQLREARDFVFVDDGEQEEVECVACIAQLPYDRAPIGDNNVRMKPGLYVCDAEYPEEGWIPLFEDADNEPDAALKGGAS